MGQSWKILGIDMFPFNWCQQFFHGKFWDALNVQENNFCSCFTFKIKKYEENCIFFNNSNVRGEDLKFLVSSTSFCFHKGLGTHILCHNFDMTNFEYGFKNWTFQWTVFSLNFFWLVLGSFTRPNWYLNSSPVFKLWLQLRDEKL